MRCPDCNKFVSLEMSDPEIDGELAVDEDGHVTGEVHITRTCADCCTALKEAQLSLEGDVTGVASTDLGAHLAAHQEAADNKKELEWWELSVENDGVDPIEETGGRFKKSYFGATVSFTIKCSCSAGFAVSGTMEGKIAAGEMDELA
jgi:hypothetical protein